VYVQYLLQYMKSVCDWLETEVKDTVTHTAWSLLRDSYATSYCLCHHPSHVAVAVLYMTLHLHGVDVPYNDFADRQWWQVRGGTASDRFSVVDNDLVDSRGHR
jgi:hypothetical protein